MNKIHPAFRYTLDALSIAAVAAMIDLLSSSFRNPNTGKLVLDLYNALGGFFRTYTLAKLFSLIGLAALGLSWIVVRITKHGDNERRLTIFLVKIGYGPQLYRAHQTAVEQGQPSKLLEWLNEAGNKDERTNPRGWWRYVVAVLIILFGIAVLKHDLSYR